MSDPNSAHDPAAAEAALRRRDRLAAMGELASTVAHEVRNPLNAIGMTAQRLRREFLGADQAPQARDEAELKDLLDVLGGETQRINRIVQQVLARGEREMPSREIGGMVMQELYRLDKVAYIRFASVYRAFQDVADFHDALAEVEAPGKKQRAAQ